MSQYSIISKQIGSGSIGKVYQIQRNGHPDDILIIKVFNEELIEQYNNDTITKYFRNKINEFSNLDESNYELSI